MIQQGMCQNMECNIISRLYCDGMWGRKKTTHNETNKEKQYESL